MVNKNALDAVSGSFTEKAKKFYQDKGESEGRAECIILGSIQTMLEDGKSKDEIFARVAKKFHLKQERFEELFQKSTDTND